MANKKRSEIREKQLAAQRTERNIRLIGLGVIVLLVVAGVWFLFPKARDNRHRMHRPTWDTEVKQEPVHLSLTFLWPRNIARHR